MTPQPGTNVPGKNRPGKGLTIGFLLCSAVLVTAPFAFAAVVFDDHFDGDSGGIPEGWYLFVGPGSAIEAGTTVTLYGDIIIATIEMMDPSQGTITLTTAFAGMDATPTGPADVGVAFANPDLGNVLGCDIQRSDGQLGVWGIDPEGGMQGYIAGYLTGYSGGPITITLILAPATFSISTDSPPFSAGPIAYVDAFPTLTRDDLGSSAMLFIQNDAVPEWWSSIDRITVDVEGGTPVEATTFGEIKALFR